MWSQGVEKSDKDVPSLQHITKAFTTADTTTLKSAHNRRGDHGTKRFTRLACKEEERAVRVIVFYNNCFWNVENLNA